MVPNVGDLVLFKTKGHTLLYRVIKPLDYAGHDGENMRVEKSDWDRYPVGTGHTFTVYDFDASASADCSYSLEIIMEEEEII
jgi:hypothetical protein